jgi:alkylation response protein AidB-like acyl-CoA dehydrogenase
VDFEFSPDQEMLRETVRRFLADRAPASYVREMLDDPRGTTDTVWKGLAELGVTSLLVPEAHGGAGMGMVDTGVVLEELGRAVHPGPFAASAVATVSAVVLAGGEGDAAAMLPGLADGSTVGTVALLEPGQRYAWWTPETAAVADGGAWAVSGSKVHVPDAGAADVFVVTASTDEGVGLFAVDAGAPGLRVSPTPTVDGTRKEARLDLDAVPARRLGDAGDASAAVGDLVDRMLVAAVVDGVGAASRALEMAVEYAKERHQFGRPIGSFQAVQHLCADMLHDVELARAGAYYALWALDAGPHGEGHLAATMAKAFASDALAGVGASLVQVLGGIGFTWEHDAHLYLKRLLSLQQVLGTSGDHLDELADLVLP